MSLNKRKVESVIDIFLQRTPRDVPRHVSKICQYLFHKKNQRLKYRPWNCECRSGTMCPTAERYVSPCQMYAMSEKSRRTDSVFCGLHCVLTFALPQIGSERLLNFCDLCAVGVGEKHILFVGDLAI